MIGDAPSWWIPIVSGLNTLSFGVGLMTYLIGFWGGVISLFVAHAAFPGFFGLFIGGIACGFLTGYLTNIECSFHTHSTYT